MNEEWVTYYLGMAEYVSRKSKDPSTRCGCVIVRPDKTLCSIGFNGFPSAIKDDPVLLNNRDQKYKFVVHAEDNAFKHSRDVDMTGYSLFVYPFMPCPHCALDIVSNGIKNVYTRPTPDDKKARWNEKFKVTQEIFYEGSVDLHIIQYP